MSDKKFPDAIINTPPNRQALSRIFSYENCAYDLNSYEAVLPGAGERIWNMYVREQQHVRTARQTRPATRSFWSGFPGI